MCFFPPGLGRSAARYEARVAHRYLLWFHDSTSQQAPCLSGERPSCTCTLPHTYRTPDAIFYPTATRSDASKAPPAAFCAAVARHVGVGVATLEGVVSCLALAHPVCQEVVWRAARSRTHTPKPNRHLCPIICCVCFFVLLKHTHLFPLPCPTFYPAVTKYTNFVVRCLSPVTCDLPRRSHYVLRVTSAMNGRYDTPRPLPRTPFKTTSRTVACSAATGGLCLSGGYRAGAPIGGFDGGGKGRPGTVLLFR